MNKEQQALKRTTKVTLAGYPVHFASCEDVIIHKMLAGRAVDKEDVMSMLIKQGGKLDTEYVREWLGKFSDVPEYGEALKNFDELLGS